MSTRLVNLVVDAADPGQGQALGVALADPEGNELRVLSSR
jgi:hypothetical protein